VTGVADDYLPGHGDLSFDVRRYELALEYKVDTNHLAGHATVHCVATQVTDAPTFDLHGLRVAKVTVDGSKPRRYQHRGGRLVVHPVRPWAAGEEHVVAVSYSGHPSTVPGVDGGAGWEELTDGVIVAAQPDGAPSWFPCNDRPSDKATYRIELATPARYRAVANGALVQQQRGASRTLWVYEQPEPMATYLATVQIGPYQHEVLEASPVPISMEVPPHRVAAARTALARQGEMMRAFSTLFGPYPFGRYVVVVTDDELEIPLESQALSTFGANHLRTDWQNQRLIAHELAHQWFGNALTLRHWRDIWLHEGFACYSEWLWSEASGGPSAQSHAATHWRRLSALPQDLILADPTRERMFDDRVYKRGALLLHAIRTQMGEGAFFDMLRSWVSENLHGTVTTGQWIAHVTEWAGSATARAMTDWLFSAPLPALPHPADATSGHWGSDSSAPPPV
jgi:aminopeptidase N